jgi:NADH pyrophosphatase NudC (nudix superfamily)
MARSEVEMKVVDILKIADEGYQNEGLALTPYFNQVDGHPLEGLSGDTLALFIVREIYQCIDESMTDDAKLYEAMRVMRRAEADVASVADALQSKYMQTHHVDAPCPVCGERNNYRDGGDDRWAICSRCNHSWKYKE